MAGDRLRSVATTSAGVTATNAKDLADQLALPYSKEVLAVFSKTIVPSAVPRARYVARHSALCTSRSSVRFVHGQLSLRSGRLRLVSTRTPWFIASGDARRAG